MMHINAAGCGSSTRPRGRARRIPRPRSAPHPTMLRCIRWVGSVLSVPHEIMFDQRGASGGDLGVVDDSKMGALQAVMHDVRPALWSRDDGPDYAAASQALHDVEIVRNPQARPPWIVAAEVDGGLAPQLGSPDIVKIAEYAVTQGFRVLRFQLVDRRHSLVSQPEQDEWSEQLVDAFQERGGYGLQILLRRDFPNVFLNGVELYLHPGIRIEVRRRGVLLTNNEQRLRSFITSAWKVLELS